MATKLQVNLLIDIRNTSFAINYDKRSLLASLRMASTCESLIERLRESVLSMVDWKDTDAPWNYTIGCVLGELGGHLFPETEQERQEWVEECQEVLTWKNEQYKKVLDRVVLQEQ